MFYGKFNNSYLCCKKINKILNKDEKKLLIGSIAPDISKQIGDTKEKSHFAFKNDNIPNIDKFYEKYKNYMDDSFVLGYYIHLYTDYIWFKYFITNFIKKDFIYTKNGKIFNLTEDERNKYIYNDYTNLNIKLIDYYNLDLAIFYEEIPNLQDIIKEIPMNKIQIIVDKTGIIIENSKESTPYLFDISEITKFIDICVQNILSDLKKRINS